MSGSLGRGLTALALAALVSGCSMGSMFGENTDARYANVSANQAQVANGAAPAIAAECPPIRVREGAEAHRAYGGGARNAASLRHQGVIDRVSRNCSVANGVITVNMGAVGRVIVGPAGTDGTVNLPLRFAVQRDGMAVFSERYTIPVAVSRDGVNEFSHTVENIAIPYVGGETIAIWVGFDG